MVKFLTDQTVNVNFIHATGMANTVTSVIVRFIPVGIPQQEENGLKVKEYGTVQTATGYIQKKQLSV